MGYYDYGLNPNINPWFGGNQPQIIDPRMNNMNNSCQCENRFMWTQSKDIARTYPMAPDKTILFLNENEPYAYFRKTDKEGKTTEFKTFQLLEEKEPEPEIPLPDGVVTKDEFDTFARNIDTSINELKSMILANNQSQKREPYNKSYNNKQRQVRNDV